MFGLGEIWAYPTDTSFGLGVRADDFDTLQALFELKQRPSGKYFSLMVRDADMLREFAEVPADLPADFFTETPRTAILKPTKELPTTSFWPADKVAFRICTRPDIARYIDYPITATSANISGEESIFSVQQIEDVFGDSVMIDPTRGDLNPSLPSEIWDFTQTPPQKIR